MSIPVEKLFAMCWKREIDIRTASGPIQIEAQAYGGLAVYQDTDLGAWVMVHLPTGLSLAQAGVFDDEVTAVKEMVALAGGRNDWVIETDAELDEFAEAVRQVFSVSGAKPKAHKGKTAAVLVNSLNGFKD